MTSPEGMNHNRNVSNKYVYYGSLPGVRILTNACNIHNMLQDTREGLKLIESDEILVLMLRIRYELCHSTRNRISSHTHGNWYPISYRKQVVILPKQLK
jgi:hypothetical protein